MPKNNTYRPVDDLDDCTAPVVVIPTHYKDPKTGALYVHEELRLAADPWAEEAHRLPINETQNLGDVDSWALYVKTFGRGWAMKGLDEPVTLATWDREGLTAILDYHSAGGTPGRCTWAARHKFTKSFQWQRWLALASQVRTQADAVASLEMMAEDVIEPEPTDLLEILRGLRANTNAEARTTIRPDGTSTVSFSRDTEVKSTAKGEVNLPQTITIRVPLLEGHTNDKGEPVVYKVPVWIRANVDDRAHLTLRFLMPTADALWDEVVTERVAKADELLGADFVLLRSK